jgi:hypothetical protein
LLPLLLYLSPLTAFSQDERHYDCRKGGDEGGQTKKVFSVQNKIKAYKDYSSRQQETQDRPTILAPAIRENDASLKTLPMLSLRLGHCENTTGSTRANPVVLS